MNENKIKEIVKSALSKPMSEKINSKEYISNRKQVKEAQSSSTGFLLKKVEEVIDAITTLHRNTSTNSEIPTTSKGGLLRAFDELSDMLEVIASNVEKAGLDETMFGDSELGEKKLTTAEKRKKEDIVMAMKKSFKGNKGAMYAIATDKAKKLAEYNENMLDEAYVPDNIKKFAKQRGVSSLVNKAAGWAEKVGKRITGGVAIGKNYDTLVLDMGYQTGDIRINIETGIIKLYDEEVNSFPEFKEVYMDENTEDKIEETAKQKSMAEIIMSKLKGK